MPKIHVAVFAQDPQTFGSVLTASSPATGASATLVYTAGGEGSLVSRISATPLGTVTATGVTVYIEKAESTVKLPVFSGTMPAYTLAAAAKLPVLPFSDIGEATPLRLGPGDKLYAAIHVAQSAGVSIAGEATDF